MNFEPFDYQKTAIDFILDNPRAGLFISMGLGKTIATLTAVKQLLEQNEIKRVLICAPLHVANSVWVQEAAKWSHTATLDIAVCSGPKYRREKVIKTNPDILVINNENLNWLVRETSINFDMVIIDESSLYKSHRTRRFALMRSISAKAKRTVLLTGTPCPQNLLDLWSQIYLLDFGKRLGKNISAYRFRFFIDYGRLYPDWRPRHDTLEHVTHLIKDITMTVRASETNNRRVDLIEKIELPPDVLKLYRTLKKELVAEYQDDYIVTPHIAAMLNKLQQITGGRVYNEEGEPVETHQKKLDRLAELRDEYPDENIIVVCNYRHHTEAVLNRFPDAVKLKTASTIEQWNTGTIPLLVCHPRSAGFGLNMQFGGSILIWFGLTWSLTDYLQMNARIDRTGQTGTVRIVHLLANKTIDETIYSMLNKRQTSQYQLMSLLNREELNG